MNIYDQRTKITIIQEQGHPLRGGSVLPDLSAPQYQIPRPPPPPLFSDTTQAQSSARKRPRNVAFEGESSSPHWSRIPSNQRPKLAATNADHVEYAPVKSVEHDTVEEDDQVPVRRREAFVDLTQDSQLSKTRRAANVGHEMADRRALADVEPKSESPDPHVSLQHLNPTSRSSLEVLESSASTSQNMLQPASSTRSEEQADGLRGRCDDRTQRQISRDYGPIPSSRNSTASYGAVALAAASIPQMMQPGAPANALPPKQAQLQTWHNRPNPPITPPSDASPADTRGRLAHPAPKSLTSNKFKPSVSRRDVFEPQSSIEDSQMSPRSKKKSKPDVDTEATSTNELRNGSQSMPKAGKVKVPVSETARLYDQDTPIVSGKRARNEAVNSFSETLSFLGDADNDQPQSYPGSTPKELEPTIAVHDALDNEESTDQSMADSQEQNEDFSRTSSEMNILKYADRPPARSDDESTSRSRDHSRSADRTDIGSNKENHLNGRNRSPSVQLHESIVDAEMEDAFSADKLDLSVSSLQTSNGQFVGVEISRKGTEMRTDSMNTNLTSIDILNGAGLRGDKLDRSGDISESTEIIGKSVRSSVELQDTASLAADSHKRRQRKKKKPHVEDDISQLNARATLLRSENGKEGHAKNFPGQRHAVLGEIGHNSNHAESRSEGQTPTSTGSSGDQLQASLQASTQEILSSRDTTTIPSHVSFSALPVAQFDGRPIVRKIYEGVILAFEADNARVAIRGIQNEPHGLLHRNAIIEQPVKGTLSRVLSLQQVVNVKVTKVKNGEIKLSMRGVDQSTRESQDGPQRFQQPKMGLGHAEEDPKRLDWAGNLLMNSSTQENANNAEINGDSGNNIEERDQEKSRQSNGARNDEAPDSGVKITGTVERAETPENQGPAEPRFGLGFTNTPRKSKKRAVSIEGADLSTVPAGATVSSGHEQMLIEYKVSPLAHPRSSGHEDTRGASIPRNGATRKSLVPKSENTSMKSHSKKKLQGKQSRSRGSIERVAADADQDNDFPRDDSNVTRNKSKLSLENTSLLTAATATAKMDVATEEYISFPPTMTKEQFLAQRQANAAAIARRDAAAVRKAGAATSSKPAKAQSVTQSATSTAKKQKDDSVDQRPLSAAFETPPPVMQTARRKMLQDKQHVIESTSRDAYLELLNDDKKHSRSGRDTIIRKRSGNNIALSTKSNEAVKSHEGEPPASQLSALASQGAATPTPSTSTSADPTKAANTTTPHTPTIKSSSKPKAQVADPQPKLAKPNAIKSTQARTPLNSKALSMAELKAQKEAAKRSSKASLRSLPPYKSTPTASAVRTALTVGSDSDESESESDSESSSDDTQKQKSGADARKKAFQKAISRPDPTIRDRSISVDVDVDDESD
jgi:predicted RNA-binding protein with RPS1 domain